MTDILDDITKWFSTKSKVLGVLLVGSYARGEQKTNSDIDIMILAEDVNTWTKNTDWLNTFGDIVKVEHESWGAVKSVRAFYTKHEIEFSFGNKNWAKIDPVDQGTKKVLAGGYKLLYDPSDLLKRLLTHM